MPSFVLLNQNTTVELFGLQLDLENFLQIYFFTLDFEFFLG